MIHNDKVIVLRSLTHSVKAKKILNEHGVDVRVVKPDTAKGEKGCGYGIAVDAREVDRIVNILSENGIPVLDTRQL